MTTTLVIISFCVVLTATTKQESVIKIAENFVDNSSKTISIISIDGALEEKIFAGRISTKAFVNFHFAGDSLADCESFSRADKYRNTTTFVQLSKFRESRAFEDFSELKTCSDCDNLIFTSSSFLQAALKCFVNPVATFLVLLTDSKLTFSDRDLIEILNRTWIESGALKVLISINENVYSFDPFNRNSEGLLGKLNSLSDASNIVGQFRNLNGHALNVEMFTGTFTTSALKSQRSVNDFTGPDASAAEFIRAQLNATSLWMILRNILKFYFAKMYFSDTRAERRSKIWLSQSERITYWRSEERPISEKRHRLCWILHKGLRDSRRRIHVANLLGRAVHCREEGGKDFAIYTSFDNFRQDALDVLGTRDYFG